MSSDISKRVSKHMSKHIEALGMLLGMCLEMCLGMFSRPCCSDAADKPLIDPCYLSDTAAYDITLLRDGVRLARTIARGVPHKHIYCERLYVLSQTAF